MQNFLINPHSYVVEHLLSERHIIDSNSPLSAVLNVGEELCVGLEVTNIIGCVTETVVDALLSQEGMPHNIYPTRPNLFPDFQIDNGYLEIKATKSCGEIKLCAFHTFYQRMQESIELSNMAFFTDFLLIRYETDSNGTFFAETAIKKLWQIADKDCDGGLIIWNGSIVSHDDIFNASQVFNDEWDFLEAAALTASVEFGDDTSEWYERASEFIAPYTEY